MSDLSWGLYPRPTGQRSVPYDGQIPSISLPRGQGRSYGDSCLVSDGTLLKSGWLDRFLFFDPKTGELECEAGVTIDEILRVFVPKGFFPPVVPGTKFVSIGGAIANDIHGKNHHLEGTFGRHILSFDLLRSDGRVVSCSPLENADSFRATIGGLGLTGFILKARLKLRPISSSYLQQEEIRFSGLEEFVRLSGESADWPYTVAWIDSLSGAHRLKGIFIRGKVVEGDSRLEIHQSPSLSVPTYFPEFVLNPFSVRIFNWLYYHRVLRSPRRRIVHYDPFFFPLDSILYWNRIYGRRGFLQYQIQVPLGSEGVQCLLKIFDLLKRKRAGSFLSVLKIFGDLPAAGMMSFPKEGFTLALDFPVSSDLMKTLNQADEWVCASGGRIYPAKDCRMAAETFRCGYPNRAEFEAHVDSALTSDFWRRVQ